jgi:hypothetical protein
MFEYLAPSFAYTLVKDAWAYFRGKKRRLSQTEILQLRQRWKPDFEREIAERRKWGWNEDVIIRDVKRLQQYPDIAEKGKGISAWFKVGLMGTYHAGILAGLSWERIAELPNGGWRICDYATKEPGIKVILIGEIPYERIEGVDWSGDEYYGEPHIFCHFDGPKGQPYERLVYCERRVASHGHPYFVDVALADDVREATAKHRKKNG